MKKYFLKTAKIALVLVYFVIVAGALVRMTGSGMGCPDWPKCFGYYIPPTDIKELTWTPNRAFEEGQVIIKDEKLWVAKTDFKTETTFDESHWRPYSKHDYAIFNAVETWIEYMNRLVGALAGIVVFAMAVLSVSFWKKNKKITVLSWSTVLLMGFQGWLGARVVYSVLNPIKITIHMIVALLIVAVLLYIIRTATGKITTFKTDKRVQNILLITLFLTVIQIILGTQVRQYVDEQIKVLGYNQMQLVLENPTVTFYIHRSFSILILALNAFLWFRNSKIQLGFAKINWVLSFIGIEIITGIAMYYFDFPYTSQPIHVVIASLLFGVQFYLILESRESKI
ncbi:COX15/CtaA family protein [Flavobacterium restrictum]|uniref:Heme A synthase n=1 Tax=Flavobacterium restrictum TaxID=2594428 RepID=A0A553E8F8_9FLAO|nr:COX15/CtaA family protein [Flavobacterium restrictum]TRX41358.1 heme A synthase [Flavobacterium restrictum]